MHISRGSLATTQFAKNTRHISIHWHFPWAVALWTLFLFTSASTSRSASLPDLVKDADNISNLNPRVGDRITVTITIKNNGTANAGASHLGIYWSGNINFTGVAAFVRPAVPGVAVGRNTVINQDITISANTAPGVYYLGYKIDDQNEVAESGEGNNGIFYWTVTVPPPAGRPDLATDNDNLSNLNPRAGDQIRATVTIKNQGTGDAGASHLGFYFSTDRNFNGVVPFLRAAVAAIGVGRNTVINQDITISANTVPGVYYLGYKIDDQNEVAESDEGNNGIVYWTLQVTANGGGGDDHGNSIAAATVVNVNSQSIGNIGTAGDNDYYRVNVSDVGTLTVYTTGNTDTYGYLLNSAGGELASNDDSTDANFRIIRAVTTGTYYVRVRHYSSTGTGPYVLRVDFAPSGGGGGSGGGGDDHGNSIATATVVNVNSQANGNIEAAGDNDYFRVDVAEAGTLTIYTTGNTDTFGYLLNGAGAELVSNDDSTDVNFRMSRGVTSGTYYVRVRHYSSNQTGAYVLRVNFTSGSGGGGGGGGSGGGQSEPDDVATGANPVRLGQSVVKSIGWLGDSDWFTFTLSNAAEIVLVTSGPSGDTEMWLYGPNSANAEIPGGYSDDEGPALFSRIERRDASALQAGTYYVKVQAYRNGATIANYTLSLRVGSRQTGFFLGTVDANNNRIAGDSFTVENRIGPDDYTEAEVGEGVCAGMSAYAKWYFDTKASEKGPLFPHFTRDQQKRIAIQAQKDVQGTPWSAIKASDYEVAESLKQKLDAENSPQLLFMGKNQFSGLLSWLNLFSSFNDRTRDAHMVLVLGYEESGNTGTFTIYNNWHKLAGEEATLTFSSSRLSGFSNNAETSGNYVEFDYVPASAIYTSTTFTSNSYPAP